MTRKPTPDDADLDTKLRAVAGLCHDELDHVLRHQAGSRINTLAIVVMTTRGPMALIQGCKCENCSIAMMAYLGRAFGGVVEIADATDDRDAPGLVH